MRQKNSLCDKSNQQILWLADPTCDKADEGSLHRNTLPTVTAFFFFFSFFSLSFFPLRAASRLAQPLPSPACDFHRQAVYRPHDSLWECFSFFFPSPFWNFFQAAAHEKGLPALHLKEREKEREKKEIKGVRFPLRKWNVYNQTAIKSGSLSPWTNRQTSRSSYIFVVLCIAHLDQQYVHLFTPLF